MSSQKKIKEQRPKERTLEGVKKELQIKQQEAQQLSAARIRQIQARENTPKPAPDLLTIPLCLGLVIAIYATIAREDRIEPLVGTVLVCVFLYLHRLNEKQRKQPYLTKITEINTKIEKLDAMLFPLNKVLNSLKAQINVLTERAKQAKLARAELPKKNKFKVEEKKSDKRNASHTSSPQADIERRAHSLESLPGDIRELVTYAEANLTAARKLIYSSSAASKYFSYDENKNLKDAIIQGLKALADAAILFPQIAEFNDYVRYHRDLNQLKILHSWRWTAKAQDPPKAKENETELLTKSDQKNRRVSQPNPPGTRRGNGFSNITNFSVPAAPALFFSSSQLRPGEAKYRTSEDLMSDIQMLQDQIEIYNLKLEEEGVDRPPIEDAIIDLTTQLMAKQELLSAISIQFDR